MTFPLRSIQSLADLLYDIPPEIYPVFSKLTLWHSPWDPSSLWQTYFMTSPLRSNQSLADLLYEILPEIYPVFGRLTLWHSPWDLSSLWQTYFITFPQRSIQSLADLLYDIPLRSIQSLADLLYDIPPETYPVQHVSSAYPLLILLPWLELQLMHPLRCASVFLTVLHSYSHPN